GVGSCPARYAPHRPGRPSRDGASMDAPQRQRQQGGVVSGEGMFGLAGFSEPSRGGGLSGGHPDAVSKRGERPGPRDSQGREPAWALAAHGGGLAWGALPAGEGPAWLVSSALWWRWHAPAAQRAWGGGASGAHGAVALPRDRRIPGGGRP